MSAERQTMARPVLVALAAIAALVAITVGFRAASTPVHRVVTRAVGDVQAVHPDVRVAGREVRGLARFGPGDEVATGDDGRARARLDDGTTVVIDRATAFTAREAGLTLARGRAFVQGAAGAHTEVVAAGATAVVASSTVAVETTPDGAKFYCAAGEVVVRAPGGEQRARAGETARVAGGKVSVAPEKAFNDWTGGMARPWGAEGRPHGAVGELWGRLSNVTGDPGSPLALRSHDVEARVEGEVAVTEARSTYFNAGAQPVVGDFRMALPPAAIVSGFATGQDGDLTPAGLALGNEEQGGAQNAKLEWAGEGWVRATTAPIAPGATITVAVTYVEWLSPANGRLTYRYPMVSNGPAPLIGEFRARIDATGANPRAIAVSPGAVVSDAVVQVQRGDFRPAADLVVELEVGPKAIAPARAYLAPAPSGDPAGAFLVVRTEAPPVEAAGGVTLALVLDTSQSIDPSALDAERGLTEAIIGGLGAHDQVVVFAADQTARPVGPAEIGPVDEGRRAAVKKALADLRPGGATDLGAALERAADAVPAGAPSAMVLYVGDGWPTLGDADGVALRARLARRAGGIPRLGAVAVGPLANRFGLAGLVRGSGPLLEIADRGDAAETAVHLLAEALKPSVAGVEVDLGPGVERVYPRGSRAVTAGSTVVTVGRVRGEPPDALRLRYRKGADVVDERRLIDYPPAADASDLRRRWAAARVEDLMLRGDSREAAVDVAFTNDLLTPWTAWLVGATSGTKYKPTPFSGRLLDASLGDGSGAFAARLATASAPRGTLGPPADGGWSGDEGGGDTDYDRAVEFADRRTLEDATGSVRQCRDSRAALRPEISGALNVSLTIDASGHASAIKVSGATPNDDDDALDHCVEAVVQNLTFFDGGAKSKITITYAFVLPPARDPRARKCSATSTLPLELRRGVWFERLSRADARNGQYGEGVYVGAKSACELPAWADRRTLLELMLETHPDGVTRVELARALDKGGDPDAAALVRREAVRGAGSPDALLRVRRALIGDEPKVGGLFHDAYAKANNDNDRLALVRRYLRLAPHDARLRRRLLALLEALGRGDEVAGEVATIRQDPFADAALLADGASALRRLGQADEARRAFGELVERAPDVPYARAYLGDRLRDEGLYDEATVAYEALTRLAPDDPAATLRLALAHAGAGRLDVAARLLARVAQTGGRSADASLQELASTLAADLFSGARDKGIAADDEERLARRTLELPLPDVAALVLVRAPTATRDLTVFVARGRTGGDEQPASVAAPSLGLHEIRVEKGEGPFRIRLRRPAGLEPSRPLKARVDVLVLGGDPARPKIVGKDVDLRNDGKDVELAFDGASLL